MLLLLACSDGRDTASLDTAGRDSSRDLGGAFDAARLEERVRYLASDALGGRRAGSEGDALAVTYVEAALAAAGFDAPADGWEQGFVDSEGTSSVNVLGVRWGADADVGDEIVVVGAHHDHLGERNGDIFAGANDDASGVAVLLGLADAFGAGAAPDRTLVLAAWGSEEVNLDGSRAYVDDPPPDLPLGDTVFYVNLDMVGTYDAYEVLYALDAVRGGVVRPIVTAAANDSGLTVDLDELGELSDSVNFCDAGVPEVFFYTEDPACYHEPCDTADRLDYGDLSAVGGLVGSVVEALTDRTVELASARAGGCPAE